MESDLAPLQFLGILMLLLGAILFFLPIILERIPSLEKIPWIILYVYRSDGFVFVTSPILIILSILSLILYLIANAKV